jgi:HEAT repeat protein
MLRGAIGAATIVGAVPAIVAAQDIAGRVSQVGDGTLRMRFATRAGVCGDGGDMVGFGPSLYIWPSVVSHGRWDAPRCVPGTARVAVTVDGGRPVSLRTFVGGDWSTGGSATDMGTVPAAQAAAYFVSLATRAEGRLSRDALLPAVIADSADIAPDLLRLARDRQRPTETRSRALHFVGLLTGASAVDPLLAIARDDDERKRVREASVFALAAIPDDAGVSALVGLAGNGGDGWLREKAVFWLGETEDPRATELLQRLAFQESAPLDLRKAAIFSLGRSPMPVEQLVGMYARLAGQELKEHFIFVLSQRHEDAALEKLIAIARGDPDAGMRKKALFWLGQSDDPRATQLIRDLVLN